MKKKFWIRLFFILIVTPIVLFGTVVGLVYWKQDAIVQELITTANKDFTGKLDIQGSHISPFANFPYISIDLDHVKVYEDKNIDGVPLLDIKDVYLGFDVVALITGNVEIKSIRLREGTIKLVQHKDGTFNIANALSGKQESAGPSGEALHLDIKSIRLDKIDLLKINEESNVVVEAFIDNAKSKFKTSAEHVMVFLDSRLEMNVMMGGDTTFVKHKHVDIHTQLDFDQAKQLLTIQPSELQLEKAQFNFEGTIDVDDDMNLDVKFHGNKPNFDMFMAFAPEELAPVLNRYENAGKIFFEAQVKGKSINGHNPLVVAEFGCEDAFFNNKVSNKRVDQLHFKGYFTTGEKRNASTMEFSLTDFSARPEAGTFSGDLKVKNFDSPEIDMKLKSDFQLDFLAQFFNIENLQDLKGSVALTMNFHDIIDLANPERSIERLNESYFTELEVKDLAFKTPAFHLPVTDVDIKASMDGHEAVINYFNVKTGKSDIAIAGKISDLPAILHHTSNPVTAEMTIKSALLDVQELTSGDSTQQPVNEQIKDLSMKLKFNSSARAFTESPNLPVGEFFIENLFAKLTHYPHTLHDFHADVYVDNQDFRIVDFTGMVDKSDFHFTGKLRNYDLWFLTEPKGDTRVEFDLTSKLLQLHDLFAYNGENYVPADYRHEEFKDLKVHGFANLHFEKGLRSADINLEQVAATMKVHPMRFEKFKGRIHYEDDHLMVQELSGKIGKSEFVADLNYYLGPDSLIRKRDNHFGLRASRLDFDELFNYNPLPADKAQAAVDHEAGFNIYELPFSDMTFDFDIKHLNYHRYLIDNFYGKARSTKNHYVYIDTLSLSAAGGNIFVKGYFNGSDPKKIYFSPIMRFERVDLDKLLFKFENFGQDHLVSENLHGKLNGKLTGKIHMHADMVPIIDDSEIHLDVKVIEGRLERYSALHAMSDYFKDKNLDRVRFDTLSNQLDMVNGVLSIPKMTINSTLGFIELSGKQDMNMNMEYYIRVPFKLVTQAAASKLFGSKKEHDPQAEDEIQYMDVSKRQSFLNIKLSGTPDAYKISLGKDRSK